MELPDRGAGVTRSHELKGRVAAVGARLTERGWMVAAAESCTGGWVGMALTAPAGASAWFVGGVVAYADRVKVAALGVETDALARHGAVSEVVARQMARGVAERLAADVGLSVTGIAGPAGGTAEKPVGTVWMAVHTPEVVLAEVQAFAGDRREIRQASVEHLLGMAIRALA